MSLHLLFLTKETGGPAGTEALSGAPGVLAPGSSTTSTWHPPHGLRCLPLPLSGCLRSPRG